MDAATERQALGDKARRMTESLGSAGERRALAFARALSDAPVEGALTFARIAAAPDWLARDRSEQRAFAKRVALVSMADHLAASIDGEWLATLAKAAGDDAMDHAVRAAGQGEACALPPGEAAALDMRGFALLRAALSPDLQPLIAWAPTDRDVQVDRATAAHCVQLAERTAA